MSYNVISCNLCNCLLWMRSTYLIYQFAHDREWLNLCTHLIKIIMQMSTFGLRANSVTSAMFGINVRLGPALDVCNHTSRSLSRHSANSTQRQPAKGAMCISTISANAGPDGHVYQPLE